MATLHYTPCNCIKRGDAILPGRRGNLYIVTKGKRIDIATCPRCRRERKGG